jgi:hypothetical protein
MFPVKCKNLRKIVCCLSYFDQLSLNGTQTKILAIRKMIFVMVELCLNAGTKIRAWASTRQVLTNKKHPTIHKFTYIAFKNRIQSSLPVDVEVYSVNFIRSMIG